MAAKVHLEHLHLQVLVQVHHFAWVGHAAVCHLADVDEAVLVDPDVDEGSEGRDVGHNAGEHHALSHILYLADTLVELEHFELRTWVEARFLKFFHYVFKGWQAAVFAHEILQAYLRAQLLVVHQCLHVDADALGHALHEVATMLDKGLLIYL